VKEVIVLLVAFFVVPSLNVGREPDDVRFYVVWLDADYAIHQPLHLVELLGHSQVRVPAAELAVHQVIE